MIILGGSQRRRRAKSFYRVFFEIASRIAPNCPELQLTKLGEDALLCLAHPRCSLKFNQSVHDLRSKSVSRLTSARQIRS